MANGSPRTVPFTGEHIPLFTEWFGSLPDNGCWTEEWVRRKSIEDPAYDPALMITAIEGGEPAGFLLAASIGGKGYIKAFVVDPARRRRGIGRLLFSSVEGELGKRGVSAISVGHSPPRYFLPGVDLRYSDAVMFLLSLGYDTNRNCRVNMRVPHPRSGWDTVAEADDLLSAGFTLRRGTAEDAKALRGFCTDTGYGGWADETTLALADPLPGVHLCTQDGRITGFAAHGIVGPRHFGPMLTEKRYRGKGIGRVLLLRCLEDLSAAGLSWSEIVWTGPILFYARGCGAMMGNVYWEFTKDLG